MRALFRVKEGSKDAAADCVLEMHKGVAFQAEDDAGPLVRLEIGYSDAGSLMRWLRMTFPGAEAHVVGLRCQGCGAVATVNLHLLGAEGSEHWCEDCAPADKLAEFKANRDRGALPHEKVATLEAVRYYLRSAYGHKADEIAEMLRRAPYSVATAAGRGMTVESVAVDIHERWMRSSARLQLEQAAVEAGNPLRGEAPR